MTEASQFERINSASAAVGKRIADVVAVSAHLRLYVQPPFDTLSPLPRRPPPGIEVRAGRVDIHLAIDALPLQPQCTDFGVMVRRVLEHTDWATATIHLHVDQLEGSPFDGKSPSKVGEERTLFSQPDWSSARQPR